MRVWNTIKSGKEELELPRAHPLHLFVCGPTVYDYSHIGHARTYLVFDMFVRFLRARGVKVTYLQNITDVDDKIIARAKEQNENPKKLALRFEKEYKRDMKALGITSVTKYARATDHIKEIVRQISVLREKGHAYEISGDGWYFDISTFPEYGKLSKRTSTQAEDATSRVDESVKKRNKGDFALWKFPKSAINESGKKKYIVTEDGEPAWRTSLGWGRPGWHIEDTAITETYFGPQYDIHGGAIDLVFPHHEAELTQQEAASGKTPFVKLWMHTGFLLANGEKMSKSKGNFITIREFLNEHSPDVLRWITAKHHYRSPMDFTPDMVRDAVRSLQKMRDFLKKLEMISRHKIVNVGSLQAGLKKLPDLKAIESEFEKALDDDFNTPLAISQLWKIIDDGFLSPSKDAAKIFNFIKTKLKNVFGIEIKSSYIPKGIQEKVDKREILRKEKKFTQADLLKKEIFEAGYGVEDRVDGPLIWPLY